VGIPPKSEIKDVFSYPNQSKYYAKYRPTYPKQLIDNLHKLFQNKKRYLDIATGSGQILFQTYSNFTELCIGNDVSATQLEMAQENLEALNLSKNTSSTVKIELIKCDAFLISEELAKKNIQGKFDVITIGAALHWFDHYKLLDYINTELLQPDGIVCVLSYYLQGAKYTFGEEEFKQRAQNHSDKFYSTIRPYFASNQDSVRSGYADIDFSRAYSRVYGESIVEYEGMSLEGFLGHLRSLSGYQAYVVKNSKEEGYVDPLEVIEKSFEKDIVEYEKEIGEKVGAIPLTVITPYFYKELSNAESK